jgi:hypothetical protein
MAALQVLFILGLHHLPYTAFKVFTEKERETQVWKRRQEKKGFRLHEKQQEA